MKRNQILSVLLFIFVLQVFGARYFLEDEKATFPEFIFQQKVDHFTKSDSRTFGQRYFVNLQHYVNGTDAPILLYINGEGMISGPPSRSDDFIVQLAMQHKSPIITLEHRFYGKSHPFTELSVQNLQYLSVAQALEDLNTFVLSFRDSLRSQQKLPNAKFHIYHAGVSYSGALSAWFRYKYPTTTKAALSSSGVVNAILYFDKFDAQIPLAVGGECTKVLREAMFKLELRILNPSLNAQTKQKFLASMLNDRDFSLMMGDVTGELVQYGEQDSLCLPLIDAWNKKEDLVDALAGVTVKSWNKKFGEAYQYSVDHLKNTTVVYEWADRQWWWQCCSELAYFQVAPKVGSIRSQMINMDYFRNLCNSAFGNNQWPNIHAVNLTKK
eukprot:TRINITY_DN1412_c0_g1_i1.p1 TRINITY_DN1412_c0_g1~~TRINITY_DN1412_c0_g1_i1.p1  ORF type:complete len:383 (-),score=134.41 TRINITY_DN1412_c0_g1_i1:82-1230(-)